MANDVSSFGGSFLVCDAPAPVFIPEAFTPEDRLIGEAADRFLRDEVLPHIDRIEAGDHTLMHELMRRAGRKGLLGADVPAVYGGLGLKVSTAALIAEKLNWQQSFALTHEAHTVIATLPLLFFGTHDQKSRYLPKLASGEWIGSFALSEANSGSDALAASTRAVLSSDGAHYILNGMKMWITNTAFAQLFTVFAQVDDLSQSGTDVWREAPHSHDVYRRGQFTAFLIERDTPGMTFGQEERKLGMRGTSTRRINLDNVSVPVENALEVGKGQYAAFCALNMGRFKLEAGAVGGLKETLAVCTRYAQERYTFGKPIAEYGMVKHKLAEMAARTFALESMVYRLAGDLDGVFETVIPDAPDAPVQYHRAAEEFAIECNIVKVIGSETYSRMTDEAIQIHGGYGYTENFPVARAWRDQRLLRIGEGANEIVRQAIVNLLLKRQAQGRLNLSLTDQSTTEVMASRGLALELVRFAVNRLDKGLNEAQEIVAAVADVVCAAYALDSIRLRVETLQTMGHPNAEAAIMCARVAARDFAGEAVIAAKSALDSLDEDWRDDPEGELTLLIDQLDRPLENPMKARRALAFTVLESGGYPLR